MGEQSCNHSFYMVSMMEKTRLECIRWSNENAFSDSSFLGNAFSNSFKSNSEAWRYWSLLPSWTCAFSFCRFRCEWYGLMWRWLAILRKQETECLLLWLRLLPPAKSRFISINVLHTDTGNLSSSLKSTYHDGIFWLRNYLRKLLAIRRNGTIKPVQR